MKAGALELTAQLAGSFTGWRVSLSDNLASLILIHIVHLVSVSPEIFTSYLAREVPCTSDQIQGFPETSELYTARVFLINLFLELLVLQRTSKEIVSQLQCSIPKPTELFPPTTGTMWTKWDWFQLTRPSSTQSLGCLEHYPRWIDLIKGPSASWQRRYLQESHNISFSPTSEG